MRSPRVCRGVGGNGAPHYKRELTTWNNCNMRKGGQIENKSSTNSISVVPVTTTERHHRQGKRHYCFFYFGLWREQTGKIGYFTNKFPILSVLSCWKIRVNTFYEMLYVTEATWRKHAICLVIGNIARLFWTFSERDHTLQHIICSASYEKRCSAVELFTLQTSFSTQTMPVYYDTSAFLAS